MSSGNRSWRNLIALAALPVLVALCFLAGRHSVRGGTAQNLTLDTPQRSSMQPASYQPDVSRPDPGSGAVRIDPEKQQLIGVHVVPVERSGGVVARLFSGTVVPQDSLVYRVTVGVDGWVREAHDGAIGSHVKKGDKLASFWSPDFIAPINSFLVASDRSAVSVKQASLGIDNANLRLRNLGMSDEQIHEIGMSRKIPDSVDIVAPADGFIIARNVAVGAKVEANTEFYRIADLNRVWILADFTESNAQNFRPGTVAIITLKDGKTLHARVSDSLPQFNRATQTMRLRLEADNPGFALRPEMLVDVQLPVSLSPGLTVPAQAILDSGNIKRVFVDMGNGYFAPRQVQTGWTFEDRVQIVSGLNPGERVVAAGAFLVDSEARMKAIAASALHSSMPDAARP